ncbi:holin [Rhodococcus sp. UNC363MFTsu5.1]|uniref:holin n=1 Tax=Rhodococcus sp. UNC363MFTsu5.1 TaxID=1449069 RepID=UPI000483291A|nr:holin [Rhodococcus sp. UNC363MFTsu5.1]
MWTKGFWQDASERAMKTGAQVLLALLTVGTTVLDLDWGSALSVSGTAAMVSILTSIVSAGFGDPNSPSLLPSRSEG